MVGAHGAAASTIGITNQSGILNVGHLDFGVLGSSFDPVSNPFTIPVPGVAGLSLTGHKRVEGSSYGRGGLVSARYSCCRG